MHFGCSKIYDNDSLSCNICFETTFCAATNLLHTSQKISHAKIYNEQKKMEQKEMSFSR